MKYSIWTVSVSLANISWNIGDRSKKWNSNEIIKELTTSPPLPRGSTHPRTDLGFSSLGDLQFYLPGFKKEFYNCSPNHKILSLVSPLDQLIFLGKYRGLVGKTSKPSCQDMTEFSRFLTPRDVQWTLEESDLLKEIIECWKIICWVLDLCIALAGTFEKIKKIYFFKYYMEWTMRSVHRDFRQVPG